MTHDEVVLDAIKKLMIISQELLAAEKQLDARLVRLERLATTTVPVVEWKP